MSSQLIDMDQYARRSHFDYFRSLPYPYVGVTVNVDVGALLTFCREHGFSFYLMFLHASALAADGVRELRQRIRDCGIIEYSECPTSHTELLKNGTYCYCTLHHHMPLCGIIFNRQKQPDRHAERKGTLRRMRMWRAWFSSPLFPGFTTLL